VLTLKVKIASRFGKMLPLLAAAVIVAGIASRVRQYRLRHGEKLQDDYQKV
jgi:hypothetical protein